MTGRTAEILDDARILISNIPDYLKALAVSPQILEGFWYFYSNVMKSQVLSRDAKLMVALDVASTDGCTTCAGGYRDMIKQAGYDEHVIEDIEHKIVSPSLDEKTQSLLVFSYALTKDPHDLDANAIDSFRKRLTDEEIVEVVATVNLFRSVLETIHGLALHG